MTTDASTEVEPRCDHCGDPIDPDDWHPALIREDAAGVRTFCKSSCRDRWRRRSDDSTPDDP